MPRKRRSLEERAAAAWLRTHAKDIPPVIDPRRPDGQVGSARKGDRDWRTRPLNDYEENMEVTYDESGRFLPLLSEEHTVNLREVEVAARVRHVLTFVSEEQADLLRAYYVEGCTLNELRRGKETRQSVHERVAWARLAFLKAWNEHAEDELHLTEEDF